MQIHMQIIDTPLAIIQAYGAKINLQGVMSWELTLKMNHLLQRNSEIN